MPEGCSLRQRVQIEIGPFCYTFKAPLGAEYVQAYRLLDRMDSESKTVDDIIQCQEEAVKMVTPLVVDVTYNGEQVEDWRTKLETDGPFDGPRSTDVLGLLYFRGGPKARIKGAVGPEGPAA